MRHRLEQLRLSDPAAWETQQAIDFDWYHGPRRGFCWLTKPAIEFHYRLLDERPTRGDSIDRIFSVAQVPDGTCQELLRILKPLGEPTDTVWRPVWVHPQPGLLHSLHPLIHALTDRARLTPFVVFTRDMTSFRGCWEVVDHPARVDDWFQYLGL